MITCLQNTIETSSWLILQLILTLSCSAEEESHVSKMSLIWWFDRRVPKRIAKQECIHAKKRSKATERTEQCSARPKQLPYKILLSPTLWKYRWGFCSSRGLHSVPVAQPDINTDSSKLNRDASMKRSKRRIRRREGEVTDSTVLMSIVMIVWHKVCFGSKCSRTNGENVFKLWLLMWR